MNREQKIYARYTYRVTKDLIVNATADSKYMALFASNTSSPKIVFDKTDSHC